MQLDKEKRIGADGFDKVKTHEFFKGINFETVLKERPPLETLLEEDKSISAIDISKDPQIEYARMNPEVKFEIDLDYFREDNPIIAKTRAMSAQIKIIKEGIVCKKCGWVFYKEGMLTLTENQKLLFTTSNESLRVNACTRFRIAGNHSY